MLDIPDLVGGSTKVIKPVNKEPDAVTQAIRFYVEVTLMYTLTRPIVTIGNTLFNTFEGHI